MINNGHHTALSPEEIKLGELTRVETAFGSVLLTNVEGKLCGFSARCPHAGADLAAGDLHRNRISCPKHDWKFNIESGRTVYPADEACRLRRYPIQIIDGRIYIQER